MKPFGSFQPERQNPNTGNYMKKKTHKDKSKDVTTTVTQKDYERELRAGVKPDETLRPGVHRGRRGGFLERHPEALTEKIETKIGIYIKLDRDILNFFKQRARSANAAPYQTQINNALRAFMERKEIKPDFSELIDNETFIDVWPSAFVEKCRRDEQREHTVTRRTDAGGQHQTGP